MKKKRSVITRVAILYIFLAVINIAFFSILISENQIDLIIENNKYQIKEKVNSLITSLYKFSQDYSFHDKKKSLAFIHDIIKDHTTQYYIYGQKL